MACIEEERVALLKLKASFVDPSNRLVSWKDVDCCSWDGVGCNETNGHVVMLDLHNGQVGFSTALLGNGVDSSLLKLKHLNYLDLSGNYFNYSQIPNFLGSMVELRYLNLSHAWFYGRVPHHLGNLTNLLDLDINNVYSYYGRYVTGAMMFIDNVEWISSLSSLQYIDLSGVNLTKALNLLQVLNTLPSLLGLQLTLCNLHNIHLFHISSNSSFLPKIQFLALSYNMFNCALPKAFQNMTSLRFLYLSHDGFKSSIPLWLGNLRKLLVVSLEFNLFTGIDVGLSSIINNNCHLKHFDLSSNFFLRGDVFGSQRNLSVGCKDYGLEVLKLESIGFGAYKIPDWLGQLKNLKSLNLCNNSLYGPIPHALGNLSNIEYLNISSNMLSGGIPTSIGKLLNLRDLRLRENKLDGVVANSIGQLRSLEIFDISLNSLKGVLSETHFANLSQLHTIWMAYNQLSFGVKSNWIPPFQLKFFSMRSFNGFGAKFPQWFQTQKQIIFLDLCNTGISGAIPTWLGGQNLSFLDLSYNQISGSLPKSIGDQMPNIIALFLNQNRINGSLPQSVCKWKNLEALDLSENNLHGTILGCLFTPYLFSLELSSNNFSGLVPSSMGDHSRLIELLLRNNNLDGELPVILRNCSSLALLDLEQNQFTGNIPTWVGERLGNLQILKLRDNMFNGTIPSSLCLLPYLQILDLADNKLEGIIPPNLSNLTTMTRGIVKEQSLTICFGDDSGLICRFRMLTQVFKSTEYNYSAVGLSLMLNIDLSNNNLVGRIPSEMTTLKALEGLNLSHNNLIGAIPLEIGGMKSLESLDLSFNQLSGAVPTSMSELNSLGVLKLSNNNFSGHIPREGHLSTFNNASTYDGNPYLCGDPLPVKCPNGESFEPSTRIHVQDDDKWEKMWLYIIIIVGYITGLWGVIGVLIFKRNWRYASFRFVDEAKDQIHLMILVNIARLKRIMKRNDDN